MDLKSAQPGQDVLLAAVLHTHSSVLEQVGRLADAASHYRRALDIAEARGSRTVAAACYHGLGTTLAALGQATDAEQNLRVAIDLYEVLGQADDAAQARQRLEQLSWHTSQARQSG